MQEAAPCLTSRGLERRTPCSDDSPGTGKPTGTGVRDNAEVGGGVGTVSQGSGAALLLKRLRNSQFSWETRPETVNTAGSTAESCLSFSKALFLGVPTGVFSFAKYIFSVMFLLKITQFKKSFA